MAAHLRAHPDWIGREFWALFRVEGMGADYQLVERTGPAWDAAVLALCQEEPAFRERLLVESREALLRDFSAKSIAWYLRMHRLADPAAHEVVASQHAYLAVLATAPSTAVGLAQDMLKRAVGLLDADAMIDAGAAVLTRVRRSWSRPSWGCSPRSGPMPGSATAFRGSSARRWKACRWTSRRWRASWWTRRTRRSGPPRMARWARGKRGGPGSHDTAAASRTVAGSARLHARHRR